MVYILIFRGFFIENVKRKMKRKRKRRRIEKFDLPVGNLNPEHVQFR